MELIGALLVLAALAYVVVGPLVLFFRQRSLERQVKELKQALERLRDEGVTIAPEPLPEAPEAEPPAPVPARLEDARTAATETVTVSESAEDEELPGAVSEGPRVEPPLPAPPGETNVEEKLASRWLVWLGGVAVALSGVFLFGYAVEQGWLTPWARVGLGVVLGAALIAAGRWTHTRPIAALRRTGRADYVPPALVGSGVFILFAAIYAAHGVFGLIGPGLAFAALGAVAFGGLVLALRFGWFVALLGLIAGYVTPMLIDAPTAAALPLFLYLFVLTAACLGVTLWRPWWWFGWATMLGAFFWAWVWPDMAADQAVLSAYALGLAGLYAAITTGLPIRAPEDPFWNWIVRAGATSSGLGFGLAGLMIVALAVAAEFNEAAFFVLGLYGALAIVLAMWRSSLESLIVIASLIAVAGVLLWPVPIAVSPEGFEQDLDAVARGLGFGPFGLPPEVAPFATALLGLAAVFGVGGFFGLRRGAVPAVWSGVSAALPVIFAIIGYWRIGGFEIDVAWAMVFGALALAQTAAAILAARIGREGPRLPEAFYAAGATAALAFAFACLFREAWLTVALSAEVLALAWIWSLSAVREIRAVASVTIGVVLLRLVANPFVLDYEGSLFGTFGWVIYGYGFPALALFLASRRFLAGGRDLTVNLAEAVAAALGVIMVSLQLRLWSAGDLTSAEGGLFDTGVQSVWWLIAGALLLRRPVAETRAWARFGGLALILMAGLIIALGSLQAASPMMTGEPVGRWPVVNLLGLAYLLPGVLLIALSVLPSLVMPKAIRHIAEIAGGVLVFIYVTLETRRVFQGPVIEMTPERMPQNAETYAYSAVWIVFALALLAIGIWRRSQPLRYASLAVLMIATAKVFLYDMSDLTGLYRVASFLGLGLTLIGIGRAYQRFVFQAPEPSRD